MYAVFGATGNTGGVVARELLRQGKQVRAIVRDARKAESLRAQGAELAVLALDDTARLTQALRGVEGAYVMLPTRVDSEDLLVGAQGLTESFGRAIHDARVPHVVLLSSVGAQLEQGTGPILSTRHAEQVLAASTPALSALRPPYFMENFAESLRALAENKLGSMLELDHVIPMIATEDIGRIAATLLIEGPRGHQVIELEGPRDYAPRDVARALSQIVGREITPERLPNEAIVPVLIGAGMSARNAELYREMHAGIDSGLIVHEGKTRRLRGKVPVEEVLRRLLAARA